MVAFNDWPEVVLQMNCYKLDEQNNPVPCTIIEMCEWKSDNPDKRRVGFDEQDGVSVSTVFLGSDHSYHDGPPVLWETMVFGGPHNEWCQRYTSHADALAGHKAAVEKFL